MTTAPTAGLATDADAMFVSTDPRSDVELRAAVEAVLQAVTAHGLGDSGSWSGRDVGELAALVASIDPCPPDGTPLAQVLDEIGTVVIANGVRTADATTAAHLHCPSLIPAAATELAIGVLNQSMDSFDQSPAGTLLEDHLVRWLGELAGLGSSASGVLTAGGTASNLLGLTLARGRAAQRVGCDIAADGLPAEAATWRILCSDAAHFSVQQAAAILGLGHRAVVPVGTDAEGRIDVAALDAALADLAAAGNVPIALVATAGTTDLGAIDPIGPLAQRARAHDLWLHVDAAVGSALLLSGHLAHRLDGIGLADSITADLHKLWWQPIGASALLVGDSSSFDLIKVNSAYLNREDDEALGVLNLVGRSLDTSRRFDALKIVVSLRTVGRERMASMVEHIVALTSAVSILVATHPDLELAAEPQTVTCVFRWHAPGLTDARLDHINTEIQRRLFASGAATIGRTVLHGTTQLKLTMINPLLSVADMAALLDVIAAEGHAVREEPR